MCNPAEQSGADYASDAKRNGFVSETDHLFIGAATNAGTSVETDEAIDQHSNGTSEHSSKKVQNSGQGNVVNCSCCQKVAKTLDQERELSKTCSTMTASFPDDDGVVNEGHKPSIYVKDYPETSENACNLNLVNLKNNVHPSAAEDRRIETMPMDKKTLIEDSLSETKGKWTEEVKFEKEALQPTSKGIAIESNTTAGIIKEFPGQDSISVVEVPNSTLLSSVNEPAVKATEEVMIDPCKSAEETEMQMDMQHADHKVDAASLLVGLVGGSLNHSERPCTETDDARLISISSLIVVVPEVEQVQRDSRQTESALKHDAASLEASSTEQHIPRDFKESVTRIEMRPDTSEGVAEQLATSSEVMQTAMNCKETEDALKQIAAGSLETQSTAEQIELNYEQSGPVIKAIGVIDEDKDESMHGTAMSSKEVAAEPFTVSIEEHGEKVVKQDVMFEEAQTEIQQEDSIEPSVHAEATDTSVSNGINGPDLAEFFNNARASKFEKEIEEQDHLPIMVKLPTKKKAFMESPRSLRMLLFSDETTLLTKEDERHKKDGKAIEFPSKVAQAAENNGTEDHTEDNYPTKWHENVDNADTSSAFSVPIAFSGALTYQGMISYSGQVAYSGSISHRSDSSTSTRSFAFPILASDWNASPVKMGTPDPRFFRQQRKWHLCFCCKRPSTLFD